VDGVGQAPLEGETCSGRGGDDWQGRAWARANRQVFAPPERHRSAEPGDGEGASPHEPEPGLPKREMIGCSSRRKK